MALLATTPYLHRLLLLLIVDAVMAVYMLRLVMPKAAGRSRLVLVAPLVVINCLLPLLFTPDGEVISVVATAFNNCWLANFKMVAVALARGPLTQHRTALQYSIVLLSPVTPQLEEKEGVTRVGSKGRLQESGGSSAQFLRRSALKCAVLIVAVSCLTVAPAGSILQDALYAVGMYTFLGAIMDGPASALTSLVDLKIAPHFNAPFVSDSVASFWGSRWNLTASNTLRVLVYDPICEGKWLANSATRAAEVGKHVKAMAACACFVVSGVMHEIMFSYASGPSQRHGRWFLFFAIQGPLVLLEAYVYRQLRIRNISVPHPIKVAITLIVLMTTAHYHFFPPPVESGLAANVSNSIYKSAIDTQQWLASLLHT